MMMMKVLLLLLSRFSRVQLCVTPQTAAHQAPLSLGFSRQEHWSGVPLPSPDEGVSQHLMNLTLGQVLFQVLSTCELT